MSELNKLTPDKARLIWSVARIGLAFVSKEGKWLKVNPFVCEILEYTEDELLRTTFESITHPQDIDSDWIMARKVAVGEIDHYVMTKRYLTKTGGTRWMQLRVDAVKDDQGVFSHFLSQLLPAEIIEIDNKQLLDELQRAQKITNKDSEAEPAKSPKELLGEALDLENVIFRFIKRNLRLVISLVIAALGGAFGLYYQYKTVINTVAENSKNAAQNHDGINDLQKNVDDIERLLKEQSKLLENINEKIGD